MKKPFLFSAWLGKIFTNVSSFMTNVFSSNETENDDQPAGVTPRLALDGETPEEEEEERDFPAPRIKSNTKQDIRDKISGINGGKYFAGLEPLLQEFIRLHLHRVQEKKIGIGQTKVGGRPDLPKQTAWPQEENPENRSGLMAFIAQINLAEIAPFDTDNFLPKSGMLYFFYSVKAGAWGNHAEDRDKFKVIYFEGNTSDLERREFPEALNAESRFKAAKVIFRREVGPPSADHKFFENIDEDDSEELTEILFEDERINKMFGCADIIQDGMESLCLEVADSIFAEHGAGEKSSDEEKNCWRLLLQIDSNEEGIENGMMWGDVGRLYFWIKEEHLRQRQFEKSWIILVCG
ncbi:MAG: DUF1963 domain-containing protein [Puniceicoccales bacterium]|jgi:uncharacterized protein YwqG|nr:DUF1963 domain-containing protein [Puniceicoccales bacterium]